MRLMAEAVSDHNWNLLADVFHDDATLEYPQSGEVFRGLANIRSQFSNYPGMNPGTSRLAEVIGDDAYALTPSYTLIKVEESGTRGTAVIRIRYPDESWWWAINLYELRGDRIIRSRAFFAPDFPAPDWRATYRETP